MTFRTIPVDIVGASYEHRSRSLSAQECVNMIPEILPSGKAQKACTSWPGSVSFSTGYGNDRGMHVFRNELYKVNDQTLYKIDSVGTQTSLGVISGTAMCSFANDGNVMRIATGSKDYLVSNAGVVSEITDPDLNPGNTVTYINQQMINDSAGTGQFQVSDVGVPGSISGSNFATAESAPDNTLAVHAFNEYVYLFGEYTIESWYNSGVGSPPFDRIQGGTMNVGTSSPYSIATSSDFMYFIGHDRQAYRVSATQLQPITPPAIAAAFEDFDVVSDARGFIVNTEGQVFYILNFITEQKTFAYSETSNAWFELSTGADQGNYVGTSYAECYGKKLVASGGSVLYLDGSTYADNAVTRIIKRVSAPITLNTGKRFEFSSFILKMETGVGLISGQGSDPQVMFEISKDGGKSFTNPRTVKIGRLGAGVQEVKFDKRISGYEMLIRITVSDAVFISIHGASAMIREAGR